MPVFTGFNWGWRAAILFKAHFSHFIPNRDCPLYQSSFFFLSRDHFDNSNTETTCVTWSRETLGCQCENTRSNVLINCICKYNKHWIHVIEHPCGCNNMLNWFYSDRRKFRVIPAESFLRTFASDRSHMKKPNGEWIKTPPPYLPIRTPGTCVKWMMLVFSSTTIKIYMTWYKLFLWFEMNVRQKKVLKSKWSNEKYIIS